MFDIQHDSPVPIHEQITSQIRDHVASGALKTGALLAEHRAFAQELLTNPQVVARAYADLEGEGVLKKGSSGGMVVSDGAAVICRVRLQDMARERIRAAAAPGLSWGLTDAEIGKAGERELGPSQIQPLTGGEFLQASKNTAPASSP